MNEEIKLSLTKSICYILRRRFDDQIQMSNFLNVGRSSISNLFTGRIEKVSHFVIFEIITKLGYDLNLSITKSYSETGSLNLIGLE